MSDTVSLPKSLARRVAKLSIATRRTPEAVLKTALNRGLDYEEWFLSQVNSGLAEADRGDLISHEEVKADLDRLRKSIGKKRRQAA